jgi:MFS family permease
MIAGPLLGGVLIEALGWRWIFMVNVPIGLFLATLLIPGEWCGQRRRLDILGTTLFSLGLLAIVSGIQNGERYHWSDVEGPTGIREIIAISGMSLPWPLPGSAK